MPDSHIWFEWQVSKTGYCWWEDWKYAGDFRILAYLRSEVRQELRMDDHYLIANADIEKATPVTRFLPLDATGLFQDFAALPLEPTAILHFANHYGLLTDGSLVVSDDISEDGHAVEGDDGDFPGEPFSVWFEEILRMHLLLEFWQLVQQSDKRGLERYIEWTDMFGHKGFQFNDRLGAFGPRDVIGAPWLAKAVQQRDLLSVARYMLDSLVTEQLSGKIDAALIRDSRQCASLRYVPRDLRTALWLQFARAIEGNKEYQQCDYCRMWYEIGSRQGARSDKKFCSTACRARHWRETKAGGKKPAK